MSLLYLPICSALQSTHLFLPYLLQKTKPQHTSSGEAVPLTYLPLVPNRAGPRRIKVSFDERSPSCPTPSPEAFRAYKVLRQNLKVSQSLPKYPCDPTKLTPHTAAVVTLEIVAPPRDFMYPHRTITLDKKRKNCLIGRTSKATVKGCTADKNNGWFDSPVMSRCHAELSADLEVPVGQIRFTSPPLAADN